MAVVGGEDRRQMRRYRRPSSVGTPITTRRARARLNLSLIIEKMNQAVSKTLANDGPPSVASRSTSPY